MAFDPKTKKILIVDDSDLVAAMERQMLEDHGFQVIRAENGVQAVIKTYSEIPDLIIMDVNMPLLQGYQASRLLKARREIQKIPIIMHTSHSEDKDRFWAFNSGANAFVTKNFENLGTLLTVIEQFIEHEPLDLEIVQKDAERINVEYVFEMIGFVFDQQLFQSTILNQLANLGQNITSLPDSVLSTFKLLKRVTEYDLALFILKYQQQILLFVCLESNFTEKEIEDFIQLSLQEFLPYCPDLKDRALKKILMGSFSTPTDHPQESIKSIASFSSFTLHGKSESYLGSLNLGTFKSNSFSDVIISQIQVFALGTSTILENAMLYKQRTEMEKQIRMLFAKFVPEEVVNEMLGMNQDASLLMGEKRNVVVLFSDIRSFTTISENNKAEDIVTFLNQFFEIMVSIINKYGGTIDKFIGDAILAIFGAPKSYGNNTERCILAATEMIRAVNSVPLDHLVLPEEGLKIGIGIHEGEVIVGNIGSKDKINYTVIGDTVNLASRMESLTKHYKCPIIISESVMSKTSEIAFLREIDLVRVKGKHTPTKLFTVETSFEETLSGMDLDNYEKGLSMYRLKNWQMALDYFSKILEHHPKDHISQMYIQRCHDFINNPPPDDWDGTNTLEFK